MDRILKKRGFKQDFYHTGEVNMNYVVGPNNGPPLLLIHGQSATWEQYTYLLPLLSDEFQVFAITLRGHGDSSWTPGQYSLEQLGIDITLFLKNVVKSPAIVAGNSSGGVLTTWLAANAPNLVRGIVLEDPPLFRWQWPRIKTTAVLDTWLAFSRMAVSGGGGYAAFFKDHVVESLHKSAKVMNSPVPPRWLTSFITRLIAIKQAISPEKALDFWFLPKQMRIMMRVTSRFDGNFSRAFLGPEMSEGFDHNQVLSSITQPILFLHSNYFYLDDGRLMGALDDKDVEHVKELVKGKWRYVRMDCGHVISLEQPVEEARQIKQWYGQLFSSNS